MPSRQSGVEVVDVGAVFLGVIAKRIGGAIGHAALDALPASQRLKPFM